MDFSFNEDQQEFRNEFRDWLETNLPDGWGKGDWQLPDDDQERTKFLKDWQRTMAEDGWAGPHWPEEYGGMGLSAIETLIYNEELARVNAPPDINLIGNSYIGPTLIELGTDWQKERFVSNILNAEEIWCLGYSEPEHGSDIAAIETKAEQDGDEFVINGQKIWTSNAHVGDYYMVATRTDSSGTKHEGITMIIVDMDQEGVQPERIRQISKDREFNQVFLDDARAPAKHVVGEVDRGWDVIRTISSFEHSRSEGFLQQRRFNELLHYCQNTTRDGRPLVEHPDVRRKLAEFDTRIEAAKRTRYRNAAKRLDGQVPGAEAIVDRLTPTDISLEIEDFAMDLLGPEATLWEDGQEGGRWVSERLQSIGLWIGGGTGDIYRNTIGEQVLGLPKDIKSKHSHQRDQD